MGAATAIRSANPNTAIRSRRQNQMIAIATPSIPPWKDIPPPQTARISHGAARKRPG